MEEIRAVELLTQRGKAIYSYGNRLYRLHNEPYKNAARSTRSEYFMCCFTKGCRGRLTIYSTLNEAGEIFGDKDVRVDEHSHIITCAPNEIEILRRKATTAVLDIVASKNISLKEANTDVASILRSNLGDALISS